MVCIHLTRGQQFLHPLIHLGYGIEFKQPAIIAEALAQAACHERWIGDFLLPAEKTAKERGTQPSKSLAQLLDEIHDDEKLNKAAHWDDGNKIRDGIIPRAGDLMVKYAAEFTVKPDELEEKTAEMTNAVCLYTAAAQHPPNMIMCKSSHTPIAYTVLNATRGLLLHALRELLDILSRLSQPRLDQHQHQSSPH